MKIWWVKKKEWWKISRPFRKIEIFSNIRYAIFFARQIWIKNIDKYENISDKYQKMLMVASKPTIYVFCSSFLQIQHSFDVSIFFFYTYRIDIIQISILLRPQTVIIVLNHLISKFEINGNLEISQMFWQLLFNDSAY